MPVNSDDLPGPITVGALFAMDECECGGRLREVRYDHREIGQVCVSCGECRIWRPGKQVVTETMTVSEVFDNYDYDDDIEVLR